MAERVVEDILRGDPKGYQHVRQSEVHEQEIHGGPHGAVFVHHEADERVSHHIHHHQQGEDRHQRNLRSG